MLHDAVASTYTTPGQLTIMAKQDGGDEYLTSPLTATPTMGTIYGCTMHDTAEQTLGLLQG